MLWPSATKVNIYPVVPNEYKFEKRSLPLLVQQQPILDDFVVQCLVFCVDWKSINKLTQGPFQWVFKWTIFVLVHCILL